MPEQSGSDELTQLGRSINQMAVSLERSRALERQFLLSVSHDLRTPLTSIRGYAEALEDGTLDDVGKGATVIRQEAARLERLVGDLLDLARLDSRQFRLEERVGGPRRGRPPRGGRVPHRRPSAPAWSSTGRSRAAPCRCGATTTAWARWRPTCWRTPSSTPTAGSRSGRERTVRGAWLTVTDDGPGIAAEDLPHVFERLYVAQLHPARSEAGSGLGLAIVRELVHAHGGEVTAEAAPRPGYPHGRPASGGGHRRSVRRPRRQARQMSGKARTRAGASPPGQRTVTSAGGSTARRT